INLLFSILLDNRFTVLFLSFLTIFGGVYVTNQFSTLQSAGNPFYYVDINSFIEKQQLSNLLFIIFPYIYTFFLLLLCILFQYYKQSAREGGKDLSPYDQGKVNLRRLKLRQLFTFERRKLYREGQVKRLVIMLFFLIIVGYSLISMTTTKLQEDYISRTEGSLAFSESLYERAVVEIENNQVLLRELRLKGEDLNVHEEILMKRADVNVNMGENRI